MLLAQSSLPLSGSCTIPSSPHQRHAQAGPLISSSEGGKAGFSRTGEHPGLRFVVSNTGLQSHYEGRITLTLANLYDLVLGE